MALCEWALTRLARSRALVSALALARVAKTIGEDAPDVVVGETVVDDAAVLASGHDPAVTEQAKLMRKRGLTSTQ